MTGFQTRPARIPLTQPNGETLRLHAETAGPPDGKLVILLHGFPEFWYGWRHQIGPLARSGLRVIVPDQRGYNLSDKPRGVEPYRIDTLAGDILGIIDYYGRDKAVIVGHDWGAAVAWQLAIHHPERVERVAILNVPHPAAMQGALRQTFRQLSRSWYIGFFQLPILPEILLRSGRMAGMRRMLRLSSQPGTFSREDIARYVQAWKQPGALTAMLNWYRAAVQTQSGRSYLQRVSADLRVRVPALILWGQRDIALIPEMAQWSLDLCDQGKLVLFPEATHWIQHDQPERVSLRLLEFIGEG